MFLIRILYLFLFILSLFSSPSDSLNLNDQKTVSSNIAQDPIQNDQFNLKNDPSSLSRRARRAQRSQTSSQPLSRQSSQTSANDRQLDQDKVAIDALRSSLSSKIKSGATFLMAEQSSNIFNALSRILKEDYTVFFGHSETQLRNLLSKVILSLPEDEFRYYRELARQEINHSYNAYDYPSRLSLMSSKEWAKSFKDGSIPGTTSTLLLASKHFRTDFYCIHKSSGIVTHFTPSSINLKFEPSGSSYFISEANSKNFEPLKILKVEKGGLIYKQNDYVFNNQLLLFVKHVDVPFTLFDKNIPILHLTRDHYNFEFITGQLNGIENANSNANSHLAMQLDSSQVADRIATKKRKLKSTLELKRSKKRLSRTHSEQVNSNHIPSSQPPSDYGSVKSHFSKVEPKYNFLKGTDAILLIVSSMALKVIYDLFQGNSTESTN